MTIKGWYREKVTNRSTVWLNSWFPFLDKRKKVPNKVAVNLSASGKFWQVWASSAPYGEIGTAPSREKARTIAVAFMRKHPGGHPKAFPEAGFPGRKR